MAPTISIRKRQRPLSEGLHRYFEGVLTHRPREGLRALWHFTQALSMAAR